MWPELKEQITVERAQLRELLELHRPLLEKCRDQTPEAVELSALAAMLHSLYTGIENVFRRATIELGDRLPTGDAWHQRLLDQMKKETAHRPRLVSEELHEQLMAYLQFRHVFRNAYLFQLRWEKMAPLVLYCERLLMELEAALDLFSERMEP